MVTELNDISKNIYKLESKNPTVGVLVYMSSGIFSSSSLEFLLLLDSLRFLLPEGFAAPVFGSASSLDCLAPFLLGNERTIVYQFVDLIIDQIRNLTYTLLSLQVILWNPRRHLTVECCKKQIV